ncbi:MAG: PASTA domain-containing protein [Deltaproteobacteria bacterium]|nr:PASTA domain-containing protein [Deltaproteobacteria bacterium]
MKRFLLFALYGTLAACVAGIATYLSVSFVVERTPEVAVPPVAGLGLAQALDALDAKKLGLELTEFEYSDQVPENHVIRQQPEAGRVVKAGRRVRVILSRGAERHAVPELAGLPTEEARIVLIEAGLQAAVATRIPGGPEGQVVAQGAAPGSRLLKGTAVPLVIWSGPRPTIYRMPRLVGLTYGRAAATLDELGVRVEALDDVPTDDPTKEDLVLRQDPAAGSPIPRGTGVRLAAAKARDEPPPPTDEGAKHEP